MTRIGDTVALGGGRRAGFDLIVVGGGTAGCVVAARASQDPARAVLLVEEGPDPRPVPEIVSDPRQQVRLVEQSDYVRRYPVQRPDGSSFPLLSGRITGGGSSVNNLAIVRPPRRDFDDWARYAGEGWSYDALLTLMRAIEDDPEFRGHPLHGVGGPLSLRRPFRLDQPADPPARALIEAALGLGLPECPDVHVREPYGICSSPYNVRHGRRQSTAVAYLDPARDRPNLTVLSDTAVTRLLFDDSSRVRGVELARAGGRAEIVEADEVVLAAGVFHSPQLLMLSGIGPPEQLERAGIRVRHALAGVGANYRDHAVVFVAFAAGPSLREDHVMPKARLIVKSAEDLEHPDLHVMFRPATRAGSGDVMLPVSLHLLDHRSTGTVALASTDPRDLPVVVPALLEDEEDVLALLNGLGLLTRLTAQPALREFYGHLVTPAPGTDWREHVMRTYTSYHHGVGTCRIGPAADPGAVVDGRLRVHGFDNLRIADASVLPTIPRANTNLAAILVGEIAARELTEA